MVNPIEIVSPLNRLIYEFVINNVTVFLLKAETLWCPEEEWFENLGWDARVLGVLWKINGWIMHKNRAQSRRTNINVYKVYTSPLKDIYPH